MNEIKLYISAVGVHWLW